jgi:polysaccharide chain length determinant protein (PEP-CTERM system associated)
MSTPAPNTNTAESGLSGYGPILRRRARYIAIIAPSCILLSVFLAFALTPLYESTSTLLLEPSSVDPKVVTTTVTSYSNQQIEIVQGRVMTSKTLEQLVKEYDPYPGAPMSPHEKARQIASDTTIERVDAVTLKPLQESNAFSLHYRNPDSDRAADVAQRLADLFTTYNQKSREQAAREAAQFLAKQAEDVSKQIRAVDQEIGAFKTQHGDALPEYVQRNESSIDREQHDIENLQQEIARVEEKESLLSVQLSQTSPSMITDAGDATDLPTVRAKLAEAQQRYTPDHPEVKRLKAALQQLSTQQSQISAGGIVANANNPLYQTTVSQLQSARKELGGLKAEAARKTAVINQYEQLLRKTPAVEREYSDIQRRRLSLQGTYQAIQDKLQNAQIAQNFENTQGGERFSLIRPPAPGKRPVFPNRIGLILLGVVLAGLFSAIAVAIAEASDSNIRDSGDLSRIGDGLVLVSIPEIHNTRDRRRRRLVFTSWAVAYGLAVVAVGVTVIQAVQ